jgi:hypothetical protein
MDTWTWQKWAVFAAPGALVVLGLLVVLVMRSTFRTRHRMDHQLQADPDITTWLVLFSWSNKVLYLPTIFASLLAAGLAHFWPEGPLAPVVAPVWITVFVINFLVEEYEVNLKLLLITALTFLALFLWLAYLEWLMPFLNVFKNFNPAINATGYLVIGLMFLAAIGISWLKGLFYYVAITHNYLNIKSVRIDTSNFLERLLGFGKIVVTFADHSRSPMILLVSNIGDCATKLDTIRGKLAVEHHAPGVNA